VDELLVSEGIDIYRQDFNMDPLPHWRAKDAPDRQGITEMRHVTGLLKILLIAPASGKWQHVGRSRVCGGKAFRFSLLSLLSVAAESPEDADIRIVDEQIEKIPWDAEVDVVGITCMTAVAPRAYEIARHFRGRGIPVVLGRRPAAPIDAGDGVVERLFGRPGFPAVHSGTVPPGDQGPQTVTPSLDVPDLGLETADLDLQTV
jgi:hypothetical protein